MAKKRRVRSFLGSLYDVKAWLGYKHIASGASIISSTTRTIINTKDSAKLLPEEFGDAITRLQLSDAELAEMQAGYLRNCMIFFIIGLLFAGYSVYRLYNAQFLSGLISIFLTTLTFIFSLASHFWYFQIKNRKLGCSLKEWYHNKINI